MKTSVQKLIRLPALIAALGLMLTWQATAQTYTNLYNFTGVSYNNLGDPTNIDGASPQAGLILSGNTFYGTTEGGGADYGSVFRINTDGSDYTNLYDFTSPSYPNYPHTNSDGAFPEGGLILLGNTLYGTASGGGAFGFGTVFRINTDGSHFTNMYTFTGGNDGAIPLAGLILSGSTLYGTTQQGGTNGGGAVFAINTTGSGFTNLYSFTGGNDGSFPAAGLILSGKTLYGTASQGGSGESGTVFAINTDGTDFTNLYTFTATDPDTSTNIDGANPMACLVLSGSTLYGTANDGGFTGDGTVFAVNTNGMANGSGFTNLYSFSAIGDYGPNNDGALPQAGLILLGNTLYGTTVDGGASGVGAVFAINTDGTDFTNLYSFELNVGNYGFYPYAGLILSGSTLYGTTYSGGAGYGTVFGLSVTLPPSPLLTITHSGNQAIVSWPSLLTGWTLQTNNNPATGIWGNYAGPVINNTATNSPPAGNLFFRLMFP
jgi:uncharacterized repeat protein (TIGR03803 family)